jgi:hypothetical protein
MTHPNPPRPNNLKGSQPRSYQLEPSSRTLCYNQYLKTNKEVWERTTAVPTLPPGLYEIHQQHLKLYLWRVVELIVTPVLVSTYAAL